MIYLSFLLSGLGNGAVYAALGVSLVLAYRSSGVINFAAGAMAMYAAYTFAFLRNEATIVNPLHAAPLFAGIVVAISVITVVVAPLVRRQKLNMARVRRTLIALAGFIAVSQAPEQLKLADRLPFIACLAISIAFGSLLGVAVYQIVFRHLRSSPPIANVVASIGVLGVIQNLVAIRYGSAPVLVEPIFRAKAISINGALVRRDVLIFAAIIVALVAVLWVLFRRTRFGLATQAAAENEKGASLLGLSTQSIAVSNWAIGGAVSAVSGILIAPIAQVNPVNFTLFIVPALAVALVGQFMHLWPTTIAALCLGMAQSELLFLQGKSWFPDIQGLDRALPFLVLVGYMVLRGKPLPSRGALYINPLPRSPSPTKVVPVLVGGVSVVAVALLTLSDLYKAGITISLIAAVSAMSVVVLTGFVGQISVAQLMFAGIGGFLVAKYSTAWGVPFPIAPIMAIVCAGLFGTLVGLPAVRVRGVNLAVLSLGAAVAVEQMFFLNTAFSGSLAGAVSESPSIFGSRLRFPDIGFGLFVLFVLTVVTLLVVWIRRSTLGYQMLAVRANERAAAAVGIDVSRVKIIAFTISACIAGTAGVLAAYQFPDGISAASFAPLGSVSLFAIAYLAGCTSTSGGLLAGVISAGGIVFVVFNKSVDLGHWYELVASIGLLHAVVHRPGGITGDIHELIAARRARRTSRVVVRPKLEAASG